MTALQAEAEDNTRKRKSEEHVKHCQQAEADARRAHLSAQADLARAREKHSALFQECEARAVQRRKAGLIETNPGY